MQMIEDLPEKARDEIKRADHLVYVTLKYTRTVDVIKSIIKRLLNAYDYIILEALEYAKETKKIKEIPASSQDRVRLVKKTYEENIINYIKLYELLKEIDKAEYSGREEYRKNVALLVNVNGKAMQIDIPTLMDYFARTKEFIELINSWVE